MQLMKEQVAQVPKLRAELASISSNLQTLVVGAAAEVRRLDCVRAEQQHGAAAELELQRQQLQQRELECEKRERALNLRQRLG